MPTPGVTLIWAAFIVIGGIIGHRKGRTPMGIIWSLILGPLGVLIIAVMPKTQERQTEEARQRARAETQARQAAG